MLSLLGVPRPAGAEDAEEAKRHFETAQTAYKLGRFQEAIKAYEAAYRALPEAAFLFNIAQAHRQQYQIDRQPDHLQKALALYRAYLRESPEAQNRQTVTRLIDELKGVLSAIEERGAAGKEPGVLVLRGDTAKGAEVRLDGKLIGTLPLSQRLPPGSYLLRVDLPGHRPWSSPVSLSGGGRLELPVVLEPLPSRRRTAAAAPLYKRWWFWTLVGAAAAGAGVGIYFGARGDDRSQMPELDLR